ncbi:hypothetical protein WS51_18365 [Burkholderia territorii]|uniref:hypothetical protein n=1 Tax=Burkholderia territorii TaxID=1503055 RepID=UPI00084129D8|nr:hypothetical protein [Burkholderia territorii]AOI67107.1 hypothetical protein WS51_18365 [Burkholderia territorii]
MANNNFKAFAAGANANVMTQADYEALAALLTGFVSGTAQSAQLNKVWRQSSIMAAVLAQFIADLTGQDAIDDGTTATLLTNLKTAVQAQSAAVVGQARNVAMSIAAASSTATISADELVVGTALGGQKYLLKQFSKTINLSTVGAGGMDTGAAPASGYVALYAIYNPLSGASALLATNATSVVAPAVYGGGNLPAGYTASALLSVWPTDSGGRLIVGFQRDRSISITSSAAITTSSNAPTQTSLSIAGIVPLNAKSISGVLHEASTAAASCTATITPGLGSIGGQNIAGALAASQVSECNYSIPILTPQSVYYTTNVTAGTPTFIIYISGYTI